MRTLPMLAALTCAAALPAQANCSAGAGPATTIATQNPFQGTSLYGHPNYPNPPGASYTGFSFVFDLDVATGIEISRIDLNLYDDGGLVTLGNGTTVTSPNQVGATAVVELYIFPGSWAGLETTPTAWGLLGSGTLTVGRAQSHSQAVFSQPLQFPAGQWGVVFKVDMPTTGPNPGPLHPMLNPTVTAPNTYTGPGLVISNLQFQRETWAASLAPSSHLQNFELHYRPTSGYANWTSFGTGCVAPNSPVLGLTARPVVGTTVNFQTNNIAANTQFCFWLFGFSANANGLGLGSFGLPGCNLYLPLGSAIVINVTPVSGSVANAPLSIPNDPSYAGIVMYGQSAPNTPGQNAGFFASNAVCVALGLF